MADYKKRTGIWLDLREAYIVDLANEKEGQPHLTHILSNIDTGVAKGGSRSKTPYGPQGGISERAVEERRHKEEKNYFESIIKEIDPDTDELFIFGPSGAKYGLKNAMEEIKHFHPKILDVRSADALTKNQIVAEIRKFFVEVHV